MLGKRSRPSVRKSQPDPIITIGSPLERSHKGWKNRESDGVGLGILAALEKSAGGGGGEISAKGVGGFIYSALLSSSSRMTSIISPRTADKVRGFLDGCKESGGGYCTGLTTSTTVVHVYKYNSSCKGVLCGGDDGGGGEVRWGEFGFFCASPPPRCREEEIRGFPTTDFLNSCFLCRKNLHGKDIYMYRGEKAFCSMECRNLQIVSDECQEKCGSEASKPPEFPSSDYSAGGGRLFNTGILVA